MTDVVEVIQGPQPVTEVVQTPPAVLEVTSGLRGLSAFQVAVAEGFEGSEAEWLESLRGETGPTGPGGVGANLETLDGYGPRPDFPLVIWRGVSDARDEAEFVEGVDLWAATSAVSESWFTDFSLDTAGVIPAGWTSRLTAYSSAVVYNDSGTKILRTIKPFGATSMLSWNVASAADVDVVMRVRHSLAPGTSPVTLLCSHVSGTAATFSGYFVQTVAGGKVRLYRYDNNVISTIGAAVDHTLAVNTWHWVRFRKVGNVLSYRLWADGADEPTAWLASAVDPNTPLPAGWTGTSINYLGQTLDVSRVGLAIDGGSAPTEAT